MSTSLQTATTAHELRWIEAALRQTTSAGQVIIDDVENIVEALRAGVRLVKVFTTDLRSVVALPRDVPVGMLTPGEARRLFGIERGSRVFALAERPRQAELSDLAALPGDLIVLDGVRLMGNIGAVIRTTAAMGAAGVVLLDSGMRAVMDRRLIRASRGLVFSVPVVVTSRPALLRFCADQRIPIFAADMQGDLEVDALSRVEERIAIALGSERRGCSEQLRQSAAAAVAISTSDSVESLNVSVAAGIALFCRQRHNLVPERAQIAALHAGVPARYS